jgi:2-polyprenyl-6-methoxyphenol hydroxylase-like FAD-dependent oxidoreductase
MTKDRHPHRVLIAGGGIGGFAAALALRRKGYETVVLERAGQLRDGGSGVHIWTNGVLALDRLGVADEVLRTAPAQDVCRFGSWRGEEFAAWPVGEFAERYGRPTLAVLRSVLHGVLREALAGSGATVHTGAQVTGFRQDPAGVTVHLADGGAERGDVLIGADGIHSAVRSALQGGARPPRFAGYVTWRGQARMVHELVPPGTFHSLFGPGTRFTFYDVAPGTVHWESTANTPAGGRDEPGIRRLIAERHRGWADPVQDIIAATPESGIMRNEAMDRKPDRRWGEGRVTLLGDAAHPMTFNLGQGACQVLEDAVVLAEHLDGAAADPVPALRAYERERRARTAPMQRIAWWLGRMAAVEHPLAVRAREALMRRLWHTRVFATAEKDQIAYGARWRVPPPPLTTEGEHR